MADDRMLVQVDKESALSVRIESDYLWNILTCEGQARHLPGAALSETKTRGALRLQRRPHRTGNEGKLNEQPADQVVPAQSSPPI
ncbi:hypothetical protein MRX96_002147 [Rhipicephalus microplus]